MTRRPPASTQRGADAPKRPLVARTATNPPKAGSELEMILAHRLAIAGLLPFEIQYPVVPGRRFRYDLAFVHQRVAIEVQGGIWSGGRHARGSGIAADCEKLSLAASLGWRVLPVTRDMIESGQAVELIRQALEV
jgi:very-short-patch-repair endonuclease